MSGTGLVHDLAAPVGTALSGMARLRRADRRRRTIILVILGALLVALALLSLTLGASDLTPADVIAVLAGGGDNGQQFIIFKLRLPRLLTAILVGIAFALAGGLFQTTLRNTLASPDILGISGGASVAAVFALLVLGLTGPAVSLIAFAGAALVAVIIGALSWRQSLSGYRFVLIGIAIAFLVSGVLGYLLTRADERSASSALLWLVGSIGDPSWPEIILLAICLAALAPVIIALGPRLRMLGLGDDTARALGTPPTATAIVALAVAVALAAAATATAGPVAFVAFVSAPIARRMMRGPGLELVAASLVSAVIVTGADLIAQHLIPANFNAPVGLVTGLIGAPYLLWLLATADRKERS